MNDLHSRISLSPEIVDSDEGQVMDMWICVHDKVFSGKSRNLADKIGCSQDEAVGLLVRMWLWGLQNCDRQGLVEYGTVDTIAEVLVQGLSKSLDAHDIADALVECRYLDIGDGAVYMHDWEEWQRYYYSYVDRKESDKKSKQESRKSKSESGSKPAAKDQYSDDFLAVWSVYPRHTNKVGAYEKYNARIKDGFSPEELLTAARQYAYECKKKHTEERYILHAETFFGYKLRFKDYLKGNAEEPVNAPGETEYKNPFEEWSDKK